MLEAEIGERFAVLFALILALSASYLAFFLRLLSLDGARAASILGVVAYGIGGLESAVLLIAFFLSSNLVGIPFGKRSELLNRQPSQERRSGAQVWANGFWFSFFICIWFVSKADMFLIGAIGAIATACADTWATEVGTRFDKARTYLITTFRKVDPGTDGGISLPGTLAAICGAAFIALLSLFFDKNFAFISTISMIAGGLVGTFADSWLGAWYQFEKRPLLVIFASDEYQDNNTVNLLATGIGALVSILIFNILVYVVV